MGGSDFDRLLVDHVCDELVDRYKYDPRTDKSAMRRLRHECEKLKKNLSFSKEDVLVLTVSVNNEPSVEITVTRKQLETMALELCQKTQQKEKE